MGVYVTRRCPVCKNVLEAFQRDYIAIGPPCIGCPQCGATVKWDHIREWDMKGGLDKIYHIFIHCYTCLFYGMGAGLIVFAICVLGLEKLNAASDRNVLVIGVLCLMGAAVFTTVRTRLFVREIVESRRRMQDPRYQELLALLEYEPAKTSSARPAGVGESASA